MGNLYSVMRWGFCLILAGVVFSGCAQPPPTNHHKSQYKSNLGKRLDIAVNYHLTVDTAIVVLDISNPRSAQYRYWLVQVSATDGQIITASRRVFTGEDKVKQLVFRLPLPIEGVEETFYVEVFDDEGKLVMKSEPISNSPIGG